jgi:hypothetical protein
MLMAIRRASSFVSTFTAARRRLPAHRRAHMDFFLARSEQTHRIAECLNKRGGAWAP